MNKKIKKLYTLLVFKLDTSCFKLLHVLCEK